MVASNRRSYQRSHILIGQTFPQGIDHGPGVPSQHLQAVSDVHLSCSLACVGNGTLQLSYRSGKFQHCQTNIIGSMEIDQRPKKPWQSINLEIHKPLSSCEL